MRVGWCEHARAVPLTRMSSTMMEREGMVNPNSLLYLQVEFFGSGESGGRGGRGGGERGRLRKLDTFSRKNAPCISSHSPEGEGVLKVSMATARLPSPHTEVWGTHECTVCLLVAEVEEGHGLNVTPVRGVRGWDEAIY